MNKIKITETRYESKKQKTNLQLSANTTRGIVNPQPLGATF
jgi:hypothetical protein